MKKKCLNKEKNRKGTHLGVTFIISKRRGKKKRNMSGDGEGSIEVVERRV